MPKSFDPFAKQYNLLTDQAIRVSGYDTKTLVDAKLKKLKNLYPALAKNSFYLLDYGCGIGNLYDSVAKFFPKAIYTGVDQSKKSIREAKLRFPDHFDFQELDSSSWKEKKYDLVFSSGVFHHISHDEHSSLIQYLSSLLNVNGKIVIWEHNPINPFTQKIVRECIFDEDAILIQSKKLKQHLENASFSKVRVKYTTFFPKILSGLNIFDPFLSWLPLGGQYLAIGEKKNDV